ncbi:hypothetical protein [Parascardovia denticolens]|uniref:hypothetical protein n=1 Tax=Parascardovia denticolens TaxID=78258 RepID=UPI00248DC0AC|nr:hypothetical protein [Parascardovia denticolens]
MRKFGILLLAEIRRYLFELRMYWSNYVSDLLLTGILIAMFALSTDARSNPTGLAGVLLVDRLIDYDHRIQYLHLHG